mmetsp:Transcript_2459/g.5209  ORF Transcript_2459/g.5209 Transcript_2459/m.5209 type:complete len:223 (-) Transcript_2459:217-885(-)
MCTLSTRLPFFSILYLFASLHASPHASPHAPPIPQTAIPFEPLSLFSFFSVFKRRPCVPTHSFETFACDNIAPPHPRATTDRLMTPHAPLATLKVVVLHTAHGPQAATPTLTHMIRKARKSRALPKLLCGKRALNSFVNPRTQRRHVPSHVEGSFKKLNPNTRPRPLPVSKNRRRRCPPCPRPLLRRACSLCLVLHLLSAVGRSGIRCSRTMTWRERQREER